MIRFLIRCAQPLRRFGCRFWDTFCFELKSSKWKFSFFPGGYLPGSDQWYAVFQNFQSKKVPLSQKWHSKRPELKQAQNSDLSLPVHQARLSLGLGNRSLDPESKLPHDFHFASCSQKLNSQLTTSFAQNSLTLWAWSPAWHFSSKFLYLALRLFDRVFTLII